MPLDRVLSERCAVCDAALRAAERSVVRGAPLARCGSCGHYQVERPSPPLSEDDAQRPAARWSSFEKAARRLLALRSLGFDGGPLLDVSATPAFAHIAAAGPFEVERIDREPNESILERLERRPLPPAHFRIVTCWSGLTLEPEPVALLEHLRDRLEPGGMLAIAAHVQDHPASAPIDLCHARHLFSRNSLRTVVLRAGFDIHVLVPADLQPRVEGLRAHERVIARASLSMLGALARERRYATRLIPEVLWRLAHTAELWARRPIRED
ncbi:MAG: hypothetical protein ACOC1F_01870 [Myxococcota bacterium]